MPIVNGKRFPYTLAGLAQAGQEATGGGSAYGGGSNPPGIVGGMGTGGPDFDPDPETAIPQPNIVGGIPTAPPAQENPAIQVPEMTGYQEPAVPGPPGTGPQPIDFSKNLNLPGVGDIKLPPLGMGGNPRLPSVPKGTGIGGSFGQKLNTGPGRTDPRGGGLRPWDPPVPPGPQPPTGPGPGFGGSSGSPNQPGGQARLRNRRSTNRRRKAPRPYKANMNIR